jgi:hypothetical protein
VHGGFTFCITASVVQLCDKSMMPLRYTEKATQDGATERAECMEALLFALQSLLCSYVAKTWCLLRYTEKATQDGATERAECMEALLFALQSLLCSSVTKT